MALRQLPSLDSLVFFEAVARHQSFSKAAVELEVSQAAVSKRIANLEKLLGYKLFDRATRRPALTTEAKNLYEQTKAALNFLSHAIAGADDGIEAPVRVGTNSATLSCFWLQDKLSAFTLSENSRGVNLLAVDQLSELLTAQVDVAFFYGDGRVNNWQTYRMWDEVLVPVAAPEVAERYRRLVKYGIDDPSLAPPLLAFPRFTPDWTTWNMWLSLVGHRGLSRLTQIPCKTYCHSIGEAIKGRGIALGSTCLIEQKLQSGELELIDTTSYATGLGYHIGLPSDRILTDSMKHVFDFFISFGDGVADSTSAVTAPVAEPSCEQA